MLYGHTLDFAKKMPDLALRQLSEGELRLIEMIILFAGNYTRPIDELFTQVLIIVRGILYHPSCSDGVLKAIAVAFPDHPSGIEARLRLGNIELGRRYRLEHSLRNNYIGFSV